MSGKRNDPPQRPLTARGAATRARIVEAAAELVGAHGVAGTSLDEIMVASETSKSQLYHYFANKNALMCAVVERQAGKVIEFQESCLKGVQSLADLREWRDTVVRLNRAHRSVGGCPIGSLASELADKSEDARALLAKSFRAWEAHLNEAFEAMVRVGEMDAAVNREALATAVMGALQGGLLLAQTTRSTKPLELSLDMALSHVERHATTLRHGDASSRKFASAGRTRRRPAPE